MKRFINPLWTAKTRTRRVLTAVGFLAIAGVFRWAFGPWLGEQQTNLAGYAVLAAATWLGTWRAGLIVAGASIALLQWPAIHAGEFNRLATHQQDSASAITFALVASMIICLTHLVSSRIRVLAEEVTRLGYSDRRKSEFLALIAHELRNPLSAISMGGFLLRSGRLDQSKAQDTWKMIERQTDQMKRLVADLLDVTRIERGKIELQRENIGVRTLVEQVIDAAASYMQPKRQSILLSIHGDPGEVFVDAMRIGQVLSNLLHNASKFSPDGSSIHVLAETTAHDVQIAVRDQGTGIPRSELRTIFDSFVQLQPRSGQPQGLGLGLALCAKLLKMHGGTIEARSEGLGCGAEFVVRVPRSLPLAMPLAAAESAHAVVHQGGVAQCPPEDLKCVGVLAADGRT
jgi:signal transduction histidine kinase